MLEDLLRPILEALFEFLGHVVTDWQPARRIAIGFCLSSSVSMLVCIFAMSVSHSTRTGLSFSSAVLGILAIVLVLIDYHST
jgi:hypothetical protein